MNYTCYACDLDNTLTYFTRGTDALIDIVATYGVPRDVAVRVMNAVVDSDVGFSHKTFVAALCKLHNQINAPQLERDVCGWLEHDGLARYPDVDQFLISIEARGLPWAIITAGNEEWQVKKIEAVNLPTDRVFVVSPMVGKADAIKKLLKRFGSPIVFVDDRPAELDRVRDVHEPDVVDTYLIERPESPHNMNLSRYEHKKIKSLLELPTEVTEMREIKQGIR